MTETTPEDPREATLRWYIPAVGMFVSLFAIVELMLNQVLWVYSGIPRKMAAAVFSSSRVDYCCQILTRIIDAQALSGDKIVELKLAMEQIGVIARTRNDILHFGLYEVKDDGVIVSNEDFAHIEARIRALHISPEAFRHLKDDIEKILSILHRNTGNPKYQSLPLFLTRFMAI